MNSKQFAFAIEKIILFLKSHKITQQEAESRLNYTSLSKAKNFDKYPQIIIEKKTRKELFEDLLNEFSLSYNLELDKVEFNSEIIENKSPIHTQYYIMHYYAFMRGVVDRALIKIINKRKVTIDYRVDERWEGNYSVIENYTFIEVTKMGYATPVKKLISLFSGTLKYGHSFLLGTYSTVKRDGYPAAGRVILQKANDENDAQTLLQQSSDYRIISYLKDNIYITKLFTPTNLDDITSSHHHQYLNIVGEYKFILPVENDWSINILSINKDYSTQLEFNDVLYYGYVSFINSNVLNLQFVTKNQDNISIQKQILTVDINIRKKSVHSIFSCAASSSIIHGVPSSFSSYIVTLENYNDELLKILPRNLFLAEPILLDNFK